MKLATGKIGNLDHNSICDLGLDNSQNHSSASELIILSSHTEINTHTLSLSLYLEHD